MQWAADRLTTQGDKGFGQYEVAALLEKQGLDIIHLEVGRPSFDTPRHIKEAAKQALDDGWVHYGDLQGDEALRRALAKKLLEYNQIQVEPEEVLLTNGLTQAAFATFMATLNAGDEVVVLEPYYPQHLNKIRIMGAQVVSASLKKSPDRFSLDPEALERAITPKTKLIVFVNPANPTGTVFSREEVSTVAEIAKKHDLLVMTDEVYDYVIYPGHQHTSLASLPGMADRTISNFAFTKAYAMDGWRLGYAAAKREFIEALMQVTLNETTHPCVFAQKGAVAAVSDSQDCVKEMVAEDMRRRDLVVKRLNQMPRVSCFLPEGTIYAFPDFSAYGISSRQLAQELLFEWHVATEEGTFYGAAGEGHLRICFGSEPLERLEEAMDRIEDYCRIRA